MNGSDAHMGISIICVRYLIFCVANIPSIDLAATDRIWTSEIFEAYAQSLSERSFFSYALRYVKQHLQQCGQVVGYSELISQLHMKLSESPASFIFTDWVSEAWGQRVAGHKKPGQSNYLRTKLLHAAARKGHSQVVEALLIAGAEVESGCDSKTPLMVAAEGGDLATVRVLLDRQAAIGARSSNGNTALHLAAANGHEPIARMLIDWGADMEAQDKTGQTALHFAAANGHEHVASMLMDRGADKEGRAGKAGRHCTSQPRMDTTPLSDPSLREALSDSNRPGLASGGAEEVWPIGPSPFGDKA